ncbi:MAG: transposase [Pseudomonadota bacterium]
MVARLEVVDSGRRRFWSDAEKLRIVAESMAGHRQVSATARRHGIKRSQLNTWRRLVREGRLLSMAAAEPAPAFTPVTVADDGPEPLPPPAASALPERDGGQERAEIVLMGGRRLIVSVAIDDAALARLVAALERA